MPVEINTVGELKDQLKRSGYIILKRKLSTKKTLIHKTFSPCFSPERNTALYRPDDGLLGKSKAKQRYVFYSADEYDQIKRDFPEAKPCARCGDS